MILLLHGVALAAVDETYGVVTKVVDGDTFDVAIQKADPRIVNSVERVRVADVSSPEMDTAAGPSAKDFTFAVLMNKRVYLDIDDLKVRDDYGRLVCVAYLTGVYGQPLTTPCFNRMLVDSGHAVLENFTNNEFDPKDWWKSEGQSTGLNPAAGQLQDMLRPLQQSAEKEINKEAKNALNWLGGQISNQIPRQGA